MGKVNHQDAAQALRGFVRIKPDFTMGHSNLGMVLTDLGKFDEAIASLEKAIELDPFAADAYRGLASTYMRTGKLEEAAKQYEKLSEITAVRLTERCWL